MRRKVCSSNDDSDDPLQGTSVKPLASRRRSIVLRCLIVGLLLVLLGVLSAYGSSPGHISNHKLLPIPISTPHTTPKTKMTPTPTPPSKPANRARLLTLSILDIKKWVAQYINFIQTKRYWQAYEMLSQDIRAKLSFEAFLANSNYVLPKGCWDLGNAFVSQRDSLTWDEGVEMTNASCFDDQPIYYANWHFRVQWQDGGLAIVSIGLYPTASAD